MFEYIKPIDPGFERRKRIALFAIPLLAILSGYLYYEFKNYREERQVKLFLQALERQEYDEAYRIWNPSRYYTFRDFSQDWGPQGLQGQIHQFRIRNSRALGSGVLVSAEINGGQQIAIWVEKRDKSLSFPP